MRQSCRARYTDQLYFIKSKDSVPRFSKNTVFIPSWHHLITNGSSDFNEQLVFSCIFGAKIIMLFNLCRHFVKLHYKKILIGISHQTWSYHFITASFVSLQVVCRLHFSLSNRNFSPFYSFGSWDIDAGMTLTWKIKTWFWTLTWRQMMTKFFCSEYFEELGE